jgi:hypothetical protein
MTYVYKVATININGIVSTARIKMFDEFLHKHERYSPSSGSDATRFPHDTPIRCTYQARDGVERDCHLD